MSRITKIPMEDWTPELRDAIGNANLGPFEQGLLRMMAHKPRVAVGLLGFVAGLKESRELPDRLVELVRLRIAFHNQCRSCMAVRYRDALEDGTFTEDLVCSLEKPMEAPNLTAAERAAIDFADRFATNHLSIGDETYAGLGTHFTEAQIVELGLFCALCVGIGRLGSTWDMVEELPSEYQDHSKKLAPWSIDPVAEVGGRGVLR